MAKNPNISNADTYQIQNRSFDPTNDAMRVVLVGGKNLTINANIESSASNTNQVTPEVKVVEIEKPMVVYQDRIIVEKISIPEPYEVTRETIRIVEVDKPVIVRESVPVEVIKYIDRIEYKEIETPLIVEKNEGWLKWVVLVETLLLAFVLFKLGR